MEASARVEVGEEFILVTITKGKNLYESAVITEIELEAVIYDGEATEVVNTEMVEAWIEPYERLKSQASIKFDVPLNNDLVYCDDIKENKFCKTWGIGKMRGLEIGV